MSRAILLAALLASAAGLRAAGPLSATPWGQPVWNGTAAELGRGGTGLGLVDSTRLGLLNPALFHMGRLTRFSSGFGITSSRVSQGPLEESFSAGHLDAVALGLPLLWQDLHAGLLFAPATDMDFLLAERRVDSEGREHMTSLKGEGGLSRAGVVLSRPLGARWRVGLQADLLFGSVLEEWKVFYPDAAPPYDSWVQQRRSLFGLQPRLGLHWQARPELGIGLAGTLPAQGDLTIDLENQGNDVDAEVASRRADLPGELALGVAWRRGGLDLLLDVRRQDWTDVPLGLASTADEARRDHPLGVALGLEWPASPKFNAPWHRRATWRAGLRREEWYSRRMDSQGGYQDVESWTFSLGAGIPLRAHGTWLDLALEAGRIPGADDAALEEDFLRVRMALSARDLWFLRPTY